MSEENQAAPNGCTGECCEHFSLEHSISYIKKKARQGKGIEGHCTKEQTQTLADMLVLLNIYEDSSYKSGIGYVYTCKKYDKETKLCKIYENPLRPFFCVGFPYGRDCNYCHNSCGTKLPYSNYRRAPYVNCWIHPTQQKKSEVT